MKRAFDLSFAGVACVLLSPLMLLLGIAIRLDSRGKAIYRQTRIGQYGLPFQLLKLRTMRSGEIGPGITMGASDTRITRIGQFLRRTKLDELPQLWHVVRGQMSLVGPRPEIPEYVALYTEEQLHVLDVKPGLTDPASIDAFDEGAQLEAQENPETYYREVILPEKLAKQLAYAQSASLLSDGRVIIRTLTRILRG
ncbi:MAG: sugar transferase [Flavobacteriales bacterium]|nr:sugar transferase [Flavobacteriales bacterium]